MKYKEIVDSICGDNWESASKEDREAGYGVACVLAFMRGVDSNLSKLSKHLSIPEGELHPAFLRLLESGIFSDRFDAKNDPILKGESEAFPSHNAWGQIAGIASGVMTYPRYYNNYDNIVPQKIN